ncbi:hypothetical protein NDU88_001757 [Pleurodeles waltl]|uniref:IclR-ED domain-containing protein n=1 Tax=Pleurodeles waltl TaxID=8319 RepID=A0AAV7UW94_PLEWA|nr:hypothetical protein NDU88_001757 [Pleurodeles waltl]
MAGRLECRTGPALDGAGGDWNVREAEEETHDQVQRGNARGTTILAIGSPEDNSIAVIGVPILRSCSEVERRLATL